MAKAAADHTFTTLRRLRNRYRLVVMNDDTYEEVITFKLSRLSVYVMLSSIFVIFIGFTVALIVFTPLKQYLPGYGSQSARKELQLIKYRTDSLEVSLKQKDLYLENLKRILSGNVKANFDTTLLKVPKPEALNN